jgi:hypothetical protein
MLLLLLLLLLLQVDVNLVASVGEEVYLALNKGPPSPKKHFCPEATT